MCVAFPFGVDFMELFKADSTSAGVVDNVVIVVVAVVVVIFKCMLLLFSVRLYHSDPMKLAMSCKVL